MGSEFVLEDRLSLPLVPFRAWPLYKAFVCFLCHKSISFIFLAASSPPTNMLVADTFPLYLLDLNFQNSNRHFRAFCHFSWLMQPSAWLIWGFLRLFLIDLVLSISLDLLLLYFQLRHCHLGTQDQSFETSAGSRTSLLFGVSQNSFLSTIAE